MELDLGPVPERDTKEEAKSVAEADEELESKQERKRHGRRKLPKDLPRKRIVLEPESKDLVCSCCQGKKRRIGSDITEELEYEPA